MLRYQIGIYVVVFQFQSYNLNIITNNVLKIGPVSELEKLLVHGLGVEQMVKLWSNRIKPSFRKC